MRRSLIFATAAVLAVSLASPSFAGERRGDGGWTPINNFIVVAAICAFSGLEDNDGGPVVPGDTQTPHESGGVTNPAGVASICQFINPGNNPKTPPPPPE